jgi:hypothetical protein
VDNLPTAQDPFKRLPLVDLLVPAGAWLRNREAGQLWLDPGTGERSLIRIQPGRWDVLRAQDVPAATSARARHPLNGGTIA